MLIVRRQNVGIFDGRSGPHTRSSAALYCDTSFAVVVCSAPTIVSRRGFDHATGIVKLQMAGSCVGCPSSTATLRSGVENMLMHYIPEVKGIQQIKSELEERGEAELHNVEQRIASAGGQ